MHVVVNHLTFRDPLDPDLFTAAQDDLVPAMRDVPGFDGMHVVQASPTEAILLIFGEDATTLDRIATEIGAPWMTANVVPLLASPPSRSLGPLIASSQYL